MKIFSACKQLISICLNHIFLWFYSDCLIDSFWGFISSKKKNNRIQPIKCPEWINRNFILDDHKSGQFLKVNNIVCHPLTKSEGYSFDKVCPIVCPEPYLSTYRPDLMHFWYKWFVP